MNSRGIRLDRLLVERGLVESREEAQELIDLGTVLADGAPASKHSQIVSKSADVSVLRRREYVGRGGLKLAPALDQWQVNVSGLICADVGSSTGGFTDCLLQRGAARVFAIDVGYGQIHAKLRADTRVVVMEGVDARTVDSLPDAIWLAVIDVTTLSARAVLPTVARWLHANGEVTLLLKPQYEGTALTRTGIVRSERDRAKTLREFVIWAKGEGWRVMDTMDCPVPGERGNREFLIRLLPPVPPHS